jgi:CheY-like chemotaxis protein
MEQFLRVALRLLHRLRWQPICLLEDADWSFVRNDGSTERQKDDSTFDGSTVRWASEHQRGTAMYEPEYEPMTETLEDTNQWCGADEEMLRGAETILFVEDEAFVRDVTCEVLRSAGYRVLSAKNAAEALVSYDVRRGEVELLLTDVVLPGETGLALAGRLRREDPDLKVLLVTGYAEQMGKREEKHEECLAKPFSTEVLLRSVRRLLDGGEIGVGGGRLVTQACGNG